MVRQFISWILCYMVHCHSGFFKIKDPFNNCISNESPIGKAIMGAHVGDICKVSAPNGAYEVKILNIL